ncbi:MAG: hypothetical protein QW756_03415 [Nitrososphaerota archaeon]
MTGIHTMLTSPIAFYKSLENVDSLRRGVAILSIATVSSIGLSLLYYRWKVMYEIFLPNPIVLNLPVFSTDYLIMSNLTSIFITAVILIGVGRLAARITRSRQVGLKNFISAVFHCFLLLTIVNTASAPFILQAPNEVVYVVGAEMENVVFFNVTATGVAATSGDVIEVREEVMSVSHVDVERVRADGSRITSAYVTERELEELIDSTRSVIRFSDVTAQGLIVDKMEILRLEFGDYVVRRTALGEVLVVSGGDGPYIASLSGINTVRNIIWRALLALFLALSLRALHQVSRKTAAAVLVVTYLILANIVPTPF